ncbi:MAG: histidine kinase, partial [Bacteroidia bacterium]
MHLIETGKRPILRRIIEHMLYWLAALLMLTFFFGANKPSFWWTMTDNLMYLPIHMLYFYTLAYWIMPSLLFKKQYFLFAIILLFCTLTSGLLIRLLDMLVIDPRLYFDYKKIDPSFRWAKVEGSFSERLFNVSYFANAMKGVNLVIWTALTVKFFKMWHERREAALEAELNFLKGQIHPHFLFNTLNNLYSLSLAKSEKAPAIVIGLS